jgi:ABC-type glycerol-3-phosphate transport system permease component
MANQKIFSTRIVLLVVWFMTATVSGIAGSLKFSQKTVASPPTEFWNSSPSTQYSHKAIPRGGGYLGTSVPASHRWQHPPAAFAGPPAGAVYDKRCW